VQRLVYVPTRDKNMRPGKAAFPNRVERYPQGGIRLGSPGIRDRWKNIFFGKRNDGTTAELFSEYQPGEGVRRHMDRYLKGKAAQ
jgi:hypothetical protein